MASRLDSSRARLVRIVARAEFDLAADSRGYRTSAGELVAAGFLARNRIEAQFQALRYFTLDGTDHPSHAEQASMIRRYIIWRNAHATDPRLRKVVKRAATIKRAKVA